MPVRRRSGAGARSFGLCFAAALLAQVPRLDAQAGEPAPLPLLDVPFISQSEALCGGAAAAMVLRYWGERGVSAESFAHLVDRSAAGIRTGVLLTDLQQRGWSATGIEGREEIVQAELARGRPVLSLIEDRPARFHYVVVVGWHERGVILHDPARAPFRVMGKSEFDKRWRAADRWMAVVVPAAASSTPEPEPVRAPASRDTGTCDGLIADGVRHAQANDLDAAERALTSALACPGPAAMRELAGVRLLQRRWPEVAELASAAVDVDPGDAHAWKLLATSRFVQDDRLGALEAWNRAAEPRLDLVRVDGLVRTRHRVVEQLMAVRAGEVLTTAAFLRARRRLAELPSAVSARLDYTPVPSGLAELRGAVAERPLFPTGRVSLFALGLSTAATREVRVAAGSLTGGGEQLSGAWRFWPSRQRAAASLRAPFPWGGVWNVEGTAERQSLTSPAIRPVERSSAQLNVSDWAAGWLRWDVGAGMYQWRGRGAFGSLAGDVRFESLDDRIDARLRGSAWFGGTRFATLQASVRARSSNERRGIVLAATGAVERASADTPHDLWFGGDTGHARTTLLRAHPILTHGRLLVSQLGRTLMNMSFEGRRWWPVRGLLHLGAAAFTDVARTSSRLQGPPEVGVDAGVGARVAVAGISGIFRGDVAKGLRDGATAVSFVYEP
jgi:hypothetical protein